MIQNMWLHITKRSLQNWCLNHFFLSIIKRLIIETFKNKGEVTLFIFKHVIKFGKLQLPQSLIFFLEFWALFLLNNVYKWVFGIFQVLFRSWVINKDVKNECVETRSSFIFAKTQDLNKQTNKKSRTPFCGHW